MRGWMWTWAIFAVACGDNASETLPVGIANGSTLVARWYVSDGAAMFRDWHDTHNEIACTFIVASDGKWRCLPEDFAIGYGDAGCTKPIASVPPCGDPPRFVTGPEQPLACGDTGRTVYAVDRPTLDQAYFYTDDTGCHRGANGTPNMLYALHEVAVDGFVAAELVHEGGGPIEPYVFHADDGAREATSAWDVALDAECRADGAEATALCEPTEIALAYPMLWGNATCTEHAAVDLSRVRPCATPSAVLDYRDGAPEIRDYYQVEERVETPYSSSGGACTVTSGLPGDVFYGRGPLIPNASFATLERVLDGTGRIRAIRYEATPGAPLAHATQWLDTARDKTCSPMRFTDGTTRCVTGGAATASTTYGPFSDASCTEQLAVIGAGGVADTVLIFHTDDCDTTYEAFAPGPAFTGAIYGGTDCTPLVREADATYVTLGDPLELPVLVER